MLLLGCTVRWMYRNVLAIELVGCMESSCRVDVALGRSTSWGCHHSGC